MQCSDHEVVDIADSRIVSTATTLPALLGDGVQAWGVALVGVFLVATVVVIALFLSRLAPEPVAAASVIPSATTYPMQPGEPVHHRMVRASATEGCFR